MMNYNIVDIEGVGPEYARKLSEAGVRKTDDLLARATDPASWQQLVNQTGIGEGLLVRWCQMADLMRLKGIGPQYGELLVSAGVSSLEKLGARQPAELARSLAEVNEDKKLTRSAPTLGEVQSWFRELGAMATHSDSR